MTYKATVIGSNMPQLLITRRTAVTFLSSLSVGCASRYPHGTIANIKTKEIECTPPRHEDDIKLESSDWSPPISAAGMREEQQTINRRMPNWEQQVVPAFNKAFSSGLSYRGALCTVLVKNNREARLPSVRSFLTAGFVYKTFTSSSYAPFVQVVLELRAGNGAVVYHQLYSVSSRSTNLFITTLKPENPFLLSDISSLQSNPAPALEALASLAEQLGQKFAMDLSA